MTQAHSAPPRPVSHRTGKRISERVADSLLTRIATGEWPLGSRLPGERQLAEEMGVSRVSVRAALQALKARGFLDAVQGGGTRVVLRAETLDPTLTELVRTNHENLTDLAEMRGLLESWAVRRAALCASDAQLAEIAEILDETAADIEKDRHKPSNDVRFHLAIAKATGSVIYLHVTGMIRSILQQMLVLHRYDMFPSVEDDYLILAHHRAIYQALCDRNPDAATRAMKAHLDWVLDRYRRERARRSSQG